MRLRQDAWIFGRHAIKFNTNPNPFKYFRLAHSQPVEPFILPRLAIDLDAADSKYVRQLEEQDVDNLPRPPYLEKERLELEEHVRRYRENQRLPITTATEMRAHFSEHTINAPDLLFYALLGHPHLEPKIPEYIHLQKTFDLNGILRNDEETVIVQQMINNYIPSKPVELDSEEYSPAEKELFVQKFNNCRSLTSLRRLASMVSETSKGCRFLAQGDLIRNSLREVRKHSPRPPSTQDVLSMVNNLRLNLESKGFEIGAHFTTCGLHYASKSSNLTALTMYLQISKEKEIPPDEFAAKAAESLVKYKKVLLRPESSRARLFLKLLTGWESDGVPSPGEKRQPSFGGMHRGLAADDILLPSYIIGLALCNEKQALWHQWKILKDTDLASSSNSATTHITRAHMFAMGFLIAKDHNSALQILEAIEPLMDGRSLPNMKSMIESYYRLINLKPGPRIFNEMQRAVPSDSYQAVKFINSFCYTRSDLRQVYDVEWRVDNGENVFTREKHLFKGKRN